VPVDLVQQECEAERLGCRDRVAVVGAELRRRVRHGGGAFDVQFRRGVSWIRRRTARRRAVVDWRRRRARPRRPFGRQARSGSVAFRRFGHGNGRNADQVGGDQADGHRLDAATYPQRGRPFALLRRRLRASCGLLRAAGRWLLERRPRELLERQHAVVIEVELVEQPLRLAVGCSGR
jgi:hypothetical protein